MVQKLENVNVDEVKLAQCVAVYNQGEFLLTALPVAEFVLSQGLSYEHAALEIVASGLMSASSINYST